MLTTTQAAARLGVTRDHVLWLLERGDVTGTKVAGRWQIDDASVDAYLAEQNRWVTYARAAELVGVVPSTVARAVQNGHVVSRAAGRNRPALERASVIEWAEARRQERQEQADRPRAIADRVYADQPPDDGHVWLSRAQAALVLGLTSNRVQQLTQAERLPAVRCGRRWWYRRDHLERAAAARAVRASRL